MVLRKANFTVPSFTLRTSTSGLVTVCSDHGSLFERVQADRSNSFDSLRGDGENSIAGAEDWSFLTARSRVLLEKLTGSHLVKKFLTFYGTHLKEPATCPYHEPD